MKRVLHFATVATFFVYVFPEYSNKPDCAIYSNLKVHESTANMLLVFMNWY